MKRKGLREFRRSTKGNTFFATGYITNQKAMKCPSVDTIYLQFHRDGEGTQTICLTPEEAVIISKMLDVTVFGGGR